MSDPRLLASSGSDRRTADAPIAVPLAVLLAIPFALFGPAGPASADSAAVRLLGKPATREMVQQGEVLYAENCAACHGENREGQPNWRRRLETGRMPAPPQDGSGHSFTHSDADLFAMTKFGIDAVVPGYESDMPGFDGSLTDADIIAILSFIKANWPTAKQEIQAGVPGMVPPE